MDVRAKKVSIIGLAKSGLSSAMLLKRLGANVFVSEKALSDDIKAASERLKKEKIDFEIGRHTKKKIENSELVILSPGVNRSAPIVKWIEKNRIPIISEIELGYIFSKGDIIAVGGTNGKTTVTTLIGEIFRNSKKSKGKKVFVSGNIGTPFTEVALCTDKDSVIALEVSSFQLETIKDFKPKVSIILNITQDHLDRYESISAYRFAKARTFLNQDKSDFLILNYDDLLVRPLANEAKCKVLYFSRKRKVDGIFFKNGAIYTNLEGREEFFTRTDILKLKGNHNIENCMAAIAVSLTLGVKKEDIIRTLKNFKTLPHRIEEVDIINGIKFIDDSKATNVDGVRRALETFEEPIVLIAGGLDKNSDFTELKGIVRRKVKSLVLIGEARFKIRDAFFDLKPVFFAQTMDEAVKTAFKKAASGDIVLLSPLCASFDMFKSYKHRGEVFKEAVKKIKKSQDIKTGLSKVEIALNNELGRE